MENVTNDQKGKKTYIPPNRSLCYQHSDEDALEINMKVFFDEPFVGNQIRLELANRTSQLVLCDLRINGGNCFTFCLILYPWLDSKKKKVREKSRECHIQKTAALYRPQEEEEADKSKQAQTEQTYEKH